MSNPRAGASRVVRTYLVPAYATAAEGEEAGLELLSEILGGGSTARLYRELVIDKSLAVDAGAYYQGNQLDYGEFTVYAVLAPGGDLGELEAALDEVVRTLQQDGVTADELARARTSLIADTIYAQDSQGRLARSYGVALTTGLDIESVRAWPDEIRAATAEDVAAAARTWLRMERSVTGTLRVDAEGGRS